MRFLSDGWLTAMHDAVRKHPDLASRAPSAGLVIQQTVTGGPDGDISYCIDLQPGRAAVRPGPDPAPTVSFTAGWDAATAISQGDRSAQEAFLAGELRLGGDVAALLEHHQLFTDLDDVFAEVRARTEF